MGAALIARLSPSQKPNLEKDDDWLAMGRMGGWGTQSNEVKLGFMSALKVMKAPWLPIWSQ